MWANVGDAALTTTIARTRTLHLLATAAGTVAAGVILDQSGAMAAFGASALMSFLLLLPVLPIRGQSGGEDSAPTENGFLTDLRAGFEVVWRTPAFRRMAIMAAVVLPLGQLSNAVLSSFILLDLGQGADVFDRIDLRLACRCIGCNPRCGEVW